MSKPMLKWRVDYVVGSTYKVKYVNAETNTQAVKRARVKNIVDLNVVNESLMEQLLDAGYPRDQIFNHESDLYVFVTPLTQRVVNKWCEDNRYAKHLFMKTFTDQISGRPMYDIPFQYTPYWDEKERTILQ